MTKQSDQDEECPVATYVSGAPLFMSLVEGDIVVEGGCLGLRGDGGIRIVPVFPGAEVTWADGVLEYDGRAYGDRLLLPGGNMEVGRLSGLRIPTGCGELTRTFVVAPQAEDQ